MEGSGHSLIVRRGGSSECYIGEADELARRMQNYLRRMAADRMSLRIVA